MLELHPVTRHCANSAILISGSARSGTTIVGKLVHSFETVEYVFEPPALIALFPMIESLPEADWNYLYQAYLYEEFLINAVSGRVINSNLADDSSIYAVKEITDIERRRNRSWPKAEAVELAAHRRVAYKIPNIVPFVPTLQARYPEMSVVMLLRDAMSTIQSLLAKHSFTPGHLSSELPWPYRTYGDHKLPYWISRGEEEIWTDLNELDRCAYYYILMTKGIEESDSQVVLRYSALVNNPGQVAEELAARLGLKFGPKTPSILNEIKPQGKPLDSSLLKKISFEFREQVETLSAWAE